ncbi:MAG TPA: hypothetical protein VIU64_19280 [Polyangia bacterium]
MLELSPPRGLGERLLALRRLPLLSVLPPAELTQLARLSRDRDFPGGAELAVENRPVRTVQIFVSGSVDLWRGARLVRSGQSFEVLDLPAVAARLPHPFTVRAAQPVHTLEIDAGLVADVLEDDFRLFLEVLRVAARAATSGVALGGRRARAFDGGDGRRGWPATRPLDAAARLMALREADLFRRAPVDGLAALARRLQVASLAPGDEVVLSDSGELTVIVEGQVTWPAGAEARGREAAGPGAVLGLRDALAGEPPLAGARAASSVLLLRAPLADLLDVLDDHHAMGRRLIAELMGMAVTAS